MWMGNSTLLVDGLTTSDEISKRRIAPARLMDAQED